MTLLSAAEDFERTLRSIPGVWNKLSYIAGLRTISNNYEHWGLAQVHSQERADSAIRQAHMQIFEELLRTPLQVLAAETAERLRGHEEDRISAVQLSPSHVSRSASLHFSSVLVALSHLAHSTKRPAA